MLSRFESHVLDVVNTIIDDRAVSGEALTSAMMVDEVHDVFPQVQFVDVLRTVGMLRQRRLIDNTTDGWYVTPSGRAALRAWHVSLRDDQRVW